MTVVETDLACARVKVKHHRQSSRSNGITEKETKKSASTPGPSPGDRPTQRRITRRLVPRPLPIDESRLERRDHTKYPIPPPESIDPRSIAIQRDRSVARARARASVVASVVARDDATEETMGGYDIPKAFSFVVTARARRSHRPASSIARPPRAAIVSPSRALARSRRPSRRVSRGTTTTVDRRKKTLYALGPWSP